MSTYGSNALAPNRSLLNPLHELLGKTGDSPRDYAIAQDWRTPAANPKLKPEEVQCQPMTSDHQPYRLFLLAGPLAVRFKVRPCIYPKSQNVPRAALRSALGFLMMPRWGGGIDG